MNKWEKLRSLPNVHVGLHPADMGREYGTVMNMSVLSGELKHKSFKEKSIQELKESVTLY